MQIMIYFKFPTNSYNQKRYMFQRNDSIMDDLSYSIDSRNQSVVIVDTFYE